MGMIKIATALLPVFLFLAALVFLDSYKLIRFRSVALAVLSGCGVAALCLFINSRLAGLPELGGSAFRIIAPLIEETAKAAAFAAWIRFRKVGFMVDAGIAGFATGAGFALVENIYYLQMLEDSNPLLWIVRGLGTAVMHGGTTALFAILSKNLADLRGKARLWIFIPGWVLAAAVHILFNSFFLPPVLMTLAQVATLPLLITGVFSKSEGQLRDWMETGMDSDARLLRDIKSGHLSETRVGQYLHSLKDRFEGEVLADMLCYLRTHLELSLRAKGILLLRESGIQTPVDPDVLERLGELRYLGKSIGKTGKIALAPLLDRSDRDAWQLMLVKG